MANDVTPNPVHTDGVLTNYFSGLGDPRRDKGTAANVIPPRILSASELDWLYTGDHYAGKIVDALPEDATREGWAVTLDADSSEPFKAALDDLNAEQTVVEALTLNRLYGASSIVMWADDGESAENPLNRYSVRGIKRIEVFDGYSLVPNRTIGRPDYYTLNQQQVRIHASRVIRFTNRYVPPRLRGLFGGRGMSELQRVFSALAQMGYLNAATDNVLQDWQVFVLQVKSLREMVMSRNKAELLERLNAVQLGKTLAGCIVADKEEAISYLTRDVTGLITLAGRIEREVASAAEMPMTRLFGSAPSGLSTDDLSGTRSWNARAKALQTKTIEPAMRRLCDTLALGMALPGDGAYTVEFAPLEAADAKAEAEVDKLIAETNALYVQLGQDPLDALESAGRVTPEDAARQRALPPIPTTAPLIE